MNDIKDLEKRITHNAEKIQTNAQQIQKNTGSLEVLHTINNNSKKFFWMWFITFIAFICSVVYIIVSK